MVIEGVPSPAQEYTIHFPIGEAPYESSIGITVRGGLVTGLLAGPSTTRTSFQLPSLLTHYGPPASVMIRTWPRPGPFGLPFILVLIYPESRFMALYQFEGRVNGDQVLGCPGTTAPHLFVWAPDETEIWLSQERIDFIALGQDPRKSLLPLEEVTRWGIEDFSSTFTSLDPTTCISTPSDAW